MALTAAQVAAYQGYVAQGLTAQQAASMVGVASVESGSSLSTGAQYNPSTDLSGILSGSGGGAFGLFSWNGSRQTDLANYAAATGGDPASLATQLAFSAQEAQNYGALTGSNTSDIVSNLVNKYTIPAAAYRASDIQSATNVANELLSGNGASIGGGASIVPVNFFQSVTGTGIPGLLGSGINAVTGLLGYGPSKSSGVAGTVGQAISGLAPGVNSTAQANAPAINQWIIRGAIILLGLVFVAGGVFLFADGKIRLPGD